MLPLAFNTGSEEGLKLLFFGAHCDDIEIGCGGTILSLIERYKISEIKWVVFASNPQRKKEATASAEAFLSGVSKKEIRVFDYRDAFLEQSRFEIKEHFETIKQGFQPDVVFTHQRDDRHQDHRLVSELAWNTYRDHLILEYEIPKYDGDLGQPNFFHKLSDAIAQKKVKIIMESYASQAGKHWFDKETFFALMRIRGLESASDARYSEAFYARKAVF
jgi:LmbE family N-acetylglucosaminyl deacetylase